MRRFRLTALGSAALMGLVGLASAPPVQAQDSVSIDWRPCTVGDPGYTMDAECGRVTVPLDRRDPAGATATLAVARHRSTGDPALRLGSILVNPGGPGGSGLASLPFLWSMLPRQVQDRFDLVTWDPRGVGASEPHPVDCGTWPSDVALPRSGVVDLGLIASGIARSQGPGHAACQAANADLIDHLGTNEVVGDLDALRAAVGDERLTYWGISYGTEIGYAYAIAHPDRIRALVLDSPMDPGAWSVRKVQTWASAAGDGYAKYAALNPRQDKAFDRVLTSIAKEPIPLGGIWELNRWNAIGLVQYLTAFQTAYPLATDTITWMNLAVFGSGDTRDTARMRLASAMDAIAESGEAESAWWVSSAILCADMDMSPTSGREVAIAKGILRDQGVDAAVTALQIMLSCSGYTFPRDTVPTLAPASGPTVPLLVIGSTHDGRTDSTWVGRMSRAFPAARRITYEGGQHSLYRSVGSPCVDTRVTRYLLTGRLPARDVSCPNTYTVGGMVR